MESKIINLTYTQTKKLIESNPNLKILDVRSYSEFKEGHVSGAINIAYEELEYDLEEFSPDRKDPVLVYCRTGRRSHLAIDTMKEFEYENIYHLYEGISEWPYELIK